MALQSPFFNGNNKRDDATTVRPNTPNGAALAAAATTPAAPAASTQETARQDNEARLTVGPNIKLKGVEITDCDTLVVEGSVEATMDSRLMQIAERGAFKGSAQIDIAEIRGSFDGDLTVRQKLVIHATGKVTGRIRYGTVVIEEGGQLSGEIEFGGPGAAAPASRPAVPKLQVA
jgi:cytoskeletal protein CcmA (bactofilin family)